MSELIQQNDKWQKLEQIFHCLDENSISKAIEEYEVKQICVDGITSKIYGKKDVEELCFRKLLRTLGFDDKEIEKIRMCVIGDCQYTSDLYSMLNHFIGYHEVPAQNVGRLVGTLKNDTRKLPSGFHMIKYNLSNPQMSTD